MKQYKELIQHIFDNGYETDDRTGTGTIAIFGSQLRFNLQDGFPAVTTKKLAWKACIAELLWFLRGSTNVNELREIQHGSKTEGKTVWDDNYENQAKDMGYKDGELGPVYGKQWRDFMGVDQLKIAINRIKEMPHAAARYCDSLEPSRAI
ncbi:thymidylate synthase [Citrobacter phage CkP1]|nr:thymidylate synthase [Citrobacter phage CkP1]